MQNLRLLFNLDANVKSKLCNFIGNLCRHSAYFYDILIKEDLLKGVMKGVTDPDAGVRKFACFAVGNVGFHNDRLYDKLRGVCPGLVELLKDNEEKIRANAAGALGNFVRNSSVLAKDLIKNGALLALLDLVLNDKGPVFILLSLYLPEKLPCFQ